MAPKCIILNGASCSGVTSIAKELQKQVPDFLHLETRRVGEFYCGMFPPSYNHSSQWDEDRFTRRNNLNSISCYTAKMILDHSMNVIIDTGFDGPDGDKLLKNFLNYLEEYKPILIGIMCDEAELESREKLVGKGHHAKQQIKDGLHVNKNYEFTVDTTNSNVEICAKEIVKFSDKTGL